ncbi:ornithine carbamoyltransferase, catabolic [Clostridia bacterium]|nr:ornithine carbamoyltransferase, catabolic [Clostridia bacterium]
MSNLKRRSFLTLRDYTPEEILYLLKLSAHLKDEKARGIFPRRLAHKNVALIFEKLSTRTRCSFTVAAADEGAHPEFLGKDDIHLGKKESVEDTARVLGRMFDGIQYRGYSQQIVETLAMYSGVPVWNGLTDDDHPTQALADFLTIEEKLGKIKGVKVVYVGDGRNNVANALMICASKLGVDFVIVTPSSLAPKMSLITDCGMFARESGGSLTITEKLSGVDGADVVYTDVWCSMGEEEKSYERITLLRPYQVNAALMKRAKADALFMHCLPAVKGNEVTEEVFESDQSVVFDQAENRMHTIKAVMVATLTDEVQLN